MMLLTLQNHRGGCTDITLGDGRSVGTGFVTVGAPQTLRVQERERFTVTLGICLVNGEVLVQGQTMVIEAEQELNLEALGEVGTCATYTRVYGVVERMPKAELLAAFEAAKGHVCALFLPGGRVMYRIIRNLVKSEKSAARDVWFVWHTKVTTQDVKHTPIERFIRVEIICKEEEVTG